MPGNPRVLHNAPRKLHGDLASRAINRCLNSLCEAQKLSAPCVVLSYCWGGPQSLTLTKSRTRLGEWAIPNDSLAQTLRDAVRMTNELGLSYLLIDSLCIV